ncbi:HD-GYP domain-containing protein [Brevibacillus ruminantium]|uniref:HD-GYP domain-containing protein n=1 Tax=Brevibacillus ruminantium TaxID=2950604 RepID=A0ABY4WAH4_9BACL|nr:HD-GYP domain-containing protein [Brevibacillus ruminantium]USG64042.1 HD-GYP domain-containing protein [Brevibacillus ruminantium]
MSAVTVSHNLIGRVLNQDLYSNTGVLLLPKTTVLTENHIRLLRNQQIRSVYVSDEVWSEGDGEAISNQLFGLELDQESVTSYLEAMEDTRRLFESVQLEKMPRLEEFTQAFQRVAVSTEKRMSLFRSLYVLEGADSYTYRHSINVGILSTLIARLLKWKEERTRVMGAAGFLHDIGKMQVPKEILLKPGQLTEQEFNEMKKHTIYGYEMINQMEGSCETLKLCALLHHERLDGSGYPEGRTEEEIPIESQVLAVADIFDAICSDRVYKSRTSPFEAAQQMWKLACDGLISIEIVSVFVHYIAQLYVGSKARLNNGEEVEIILIHKDEPMRPLVRRAQEFIDLRNHRQLMIEKMIG